MSDAAKPLRKGADRPWGETSCGYGLNDPECFAPATTHIMWLDTAHTSQACDEHMATIRDRGTVAPIETHTFGPECGMPGTLWHHPYEDEPEGYCLFPAPEDAALLVAEDEPAVTEASA